MGFFNWLINGGGEQPAERAFGNTDLKQLASSLRYADCRTLAKWALDAVSGANVDNYFAYMPDDAHVEICAEKHGKIYDVVLHDIRVRGCSVILVHTLSPTQASSGWKATAFESGTAFYPGMSFTLSVLSRTRDDSIEAHGIDHTASELRDMGYDIVCTME